MPGAVDGGSSVTDAGVGALGVSALEVVVDLPDRSSGKASGCSTPIVSHACMCNSCQDVLSGSVGRRYDQFIRRRGSAGHYPPTNTTGTGAHGHAGVCALPCFHTRTCNAEYPRIGLKRTIDKIAFVLTRIVTRVRT